MARPFKFRAPLMKPARLRKLGKAVGTILKGLVAVSSALVPAPPRPAKARAVKTKVVSPKPGAATRKVAPTFGFTQHSFVSVHGSRDYKLYVPAVPHKRAVPLVVMLHGCSQSPDDFAAGTQMNRLADTHGFLVAYPAQPSSANAAKCWNWFNGKHQKRGEGEPALIAGITRQIMKTHKVDPRRVYIAGLSAGGAAAAIMADAYPDLYAAVGVHSGVACGAASDMMSAHAAMTKGATVAPRDGRSRIGRPLIVFHGDNDRTVHPSNADVLIARRGAEAGIRMTQNAGKTSGGVPFTRTVYSDRSGKSVMENWRVHKGGHAWFGGSSTGSYATPDGPDASREMIRFFLEHTL